MLKNNLNSILLFLFCCYGNWAIAQGDFNYSDVLGKSIEFYDGQICGPQPSWSRAAWRNNCHMNDGSDIGKNLTGGWHDAGDHTKFNYVSAQATRVLAWSYLQYRPSFDNSGNKTHLLNHLRLSGDFMIKLHPSANVFYAQIGRAKTGSNPEHNEWVAPSLQSPSIDRSVTTINTSKPGTHMAASNAAAFASLAMVFKNEDASYSSSLLQHAKDLFSFADNHRGNHYDQLGSPEPYPMNDFDDDLFVAAIWLYKATNENQYLDRAKTEYNKVSNNVGWMMHYRDHAYEGYLLMAQITGEQKYYNSAENWLDNEIDNAPRTNGGLYYRSNFLAASLAQSMAFGAYFYAELRGTGFSKYNKYRNFAFQQIDYVLGDNPRNSSYVVGYGNNPTTITHHRGASGVPQNSTAPDKHVHVGSLAGGPQQNDSFNEVRTDVKSTEPAISQQAFFVGMAAMMVKETGGGTPVPDPDPVTEGSQEIEGNFTVFNEAGGSFSVGVDNSNPGASSGQYVRLFETNDELSTTFTVAESGDYKIDLRVRTGELSASSTNNMVGQYEVRIDGTIRTFSFVSGSASALDGDTYWGRISHTRNLSAGSHTVRIKAKANWLKADRLDFEKTTVTPPPPPSSGNSITIRAKGDCGTETMQLRVDGTTVKTWNNVSTSFATYTYNGFASGEVSVHFTNNGSSGSCGDKNLEVDWIEVCGTRLQTETEATETASCCLGDPDKLYTNGNFNFGSRSCGGPETGSVVVRAKGDCGTETMQLRVDGTTVKTWNNVSTAFTSYTYNGFTSGAVSVHFTNDGSSGSCSDKNLQVDWIEICGARLQTETQATETSSCCAYDPDKLYTNGNFNFGNRSCGSASLKTELSETGAPAISFFPNPVRNGVVNLVSQNDFRVRILDMLGREVLNSPEMQAGTRELSLDGLRSGLYILEVTDMLSRNRSTSKLIVE
ncbi:glycoside hydrolase family 9 protein [Maribacter sp. 2-571]|uniref:glycoside hydrolase family 9 protein n=1 Tax=Maribacter sp. 2-571 TaxID=3417569 RepID=UPI003D349EDC